MIFVTGNTFHWRPLQKIPDKSVIAGVVDNGEKFIASNKNTDDNFFLWCCFCNGQVMNIKLEMSPRKV
jgi:hypothetical protein